MQASNYDKYSHLADATTAVSSGISGEIDMAGFEGCQFVAIIGSSGLATTVTVSQAASTTATFVNVDGGTKSSTGGKALVLVDVYRPRKRYLKATTTNTTVGCRHQLVARQYGVRKLQSATTYDTAVVSPDT